MASLNTALRQFDEYLAVAQMTAEEFAAEATENLAAWAGWLMGVSPFPRQQAIRASSARTYAKSLISALRQLRGCHLHVDSALLAKRLEALEYQRRNQRRRVKAQTTNENQKR